MFPRWIEIARFWTFSTDSLGPVTRVPQAYKEWRLSLGFDEISFGVGGLHLEGLDELAEAQIGYSISAEGESFCTGQPGDWQDSWLVIGHDTAAGDPVILDTSAKTLHVLTAMHGAGTWDPTCIAASLDAFGAALKEVRRLSKGRENPVNLEKHPLSPTERSEALERIEAANPGVDMQFWESQLYVEEDGA